MLRTTVATVAVAAAVGLVGAPVANASCHYRSSTGTHSITCPSEDHDQFVKDLRRIQRKEFVDKIVGKIVDKIKRPIEHLPRSVDNPDIAGKKKVRIAEN